MKIFSIFNGFKSFFKNLKEEVDEIEDFFLKEEITCIEKFKEMVSSIALIESFEVVGDVINISILTQDEDDDDEIIYFSANLKEIELKDYYNRILNEILEG